MPSKMALKLILHEQIYLQAFNYGGMLDLNGVALVVWLAVTQMVELLHTILITIKAVPLQVFLATRVAILTKKLKVLFTALINKKTLPFGMSSIQIVTWQLVLRLT